MYSENTIPEERTLMEAHERFLAQKRGAYKSGYKKGIEEEKARAEAIIADKDQIIAERDRKIAEKDQKIAELEAKLKKQLNNNS